MHLAAVTTPRKIRSLIKEFAAQLESPEVVPERRIGNPSSTSICDVHVHRDLDIWVVLEEHGNETQTWNVFGRIDERLDSPSLNLEHVCQINFVHDDAPGNVGGLFAANRTGARTFVTHSGRLGGGFPGVGKDTFLAFLHEHAPGLGPVDIELADGRWTRRLIVGELGASDFRAKVARFVHLADTFKRAVRGLPPRPVRSPDNELASGQGRQTDPKVRRAVEEFAMLRAEAYYRSLGYTTIERMTAQPGELDLRCLRRGIERRVEVKGTTSHGASVELTAAEHRRAVEAIPPVDLVVVSQIRIDNTISPPRASGGVLHVYRDFDPTQHKLIVTTYRCVLEKTLGKPS